MTIVNVINQINDLFNAFNRESDAFTVDYDGKTDSLYCYYIPSVNDCGFVVTDNLLSVSDTSKEDLKKLKDFLDENWIKSRNDCEWSIDWGWREN